MDVAKRVILNTAAQYIRTFVNIILSLYSTRLVLYALGESDYGIFQLVGGIVAMLGFLTNAMVVTTQRHLSFAHGQGDPKAIRKVFSNSLFLHIVFGIVLVCVLASLTPWLIDFLSIPPERMDIAKMVYLITLLTLFLSFIVAPFRALFIARENIVFISCIDIIDGILKVLFVLFFLLVFQNRLLAYAWLMTALMLFNLLTFSLYCISHYAEATLFPSLSTISWTAQRRILGFASWTTYSLGCIISRNQGMAVILNHIFRNTLINTAYGIALQVSGSAGFISQSIINAMSPQIVKAEGRGDRLQMLSLATSASKYAFLLLAFVVVPLIVETPQVLDFWLGIGHYPPETVIFCRFILLAALCDQITVGLGIANQATGKIRTYSLIINTIKLLTLLVAYLSFVFGATITVVMWCYVFIELLCAVIRLPLLRATVGLSIRKFVQAVCARIAIPFVMIVGVCLVVIQEVTIPFRFLLTLILSVIVGATVSWFFALGDSERAALLRMLKKQEMI